jgi:hypothetical protein
MTMKKNLLLFAIFLLPLIGMAQTTIFTDNFNRGSGTSSAMTSSIASTTGTWSSSSTSVTVASASNITLGSLVTATGIPVTAYVTAISGTTITISEASTASGTAAAISFGPNYATTTTSTGTGAGAISRLYQTTGTDYALQILPGDNSTGNTQTSGVTYTTATYPTNSLLNTQLNLNSSDLVWSFHLRTNRSTFPLSGGITTGNNWGGAVILAATSATVPSAGNGYAVILEPGYTAFGSTTNSSTTVTLNSNSASALGIQTGMTISGTGILASTKVTATSGNQITISNAANATNTDKKFTFTWVVAGTTTNASTSLTLSSAPPSNTFFAGQAITGTGIPSSTTISAITGSTITLSAAATASGTVSDITIGGGTTLKLVRYTGGIVSANSSSINRIPIITPQQECWSSGTKSNWAGVKVIYTPLTDTWQMFTRNDGSSTASPSTDFSSGLTSAGSVVDNSYTGSSSSKFGFLWNYSASITATSNTFLVDNFSLTVNNPTINAPSVSSLSGFTASSSVASSEQSFTISGQYLTKSIEVTAPTGYEVSATSGVSPSTASWGSKVTLTNAATVSSTSIYVRLKNNSSVGSKTGNITIASDGATSTSSYTVALSGTVSSTPTLTPSTSTLTQFANTAAGSNSASKSFTLSGVNLTGGNVTVTAPTNFTVSTDDATYSNSVTITPSTGIVSSTIYVKYSPTGNGGYSGNVVVSSPDITSDQNVAVSGYLSKFYYISGSTSLATLANWSGKADGTGTSVPSNFTTDGVSYVILSSTSTTDASWTVAGTGSKIVVGDPTVAGVTLTIADAKIITTTSPAVLDIPAALTGANSLVISDVNTTASTNAFTFGTLHTSSEVHFHAGTSSSLLLMPVAIYGKVIVDDGYTAQTTGGAYSTIRTSLSVGTTSNSTALMGINSSTNYLLMDNGATATIYGTLSIQRLPGAFQFYSLSLSSYPGTTYGSLQFKDAYNTVTPNLTLATNSTVAYCRTSSTSTSTQAISLLPNGMSYQNLTISDVSGSGMLVTKTFAAGAHTIAGTFTINHVNPTTSTIALGTATVTANGPVVLTKGQLINSGNLTLGNSATITVGAGSFDAAPTFGTAIDLTYNGTTEITSGFEMPSSTSVLRNLTLNNAGGLTIGSDVTVNNTITLTSGKLSIAAGKTLTLPSSTALISGANSTNYIVTATSGTNIGKVKMTGFATAKTLPIGTANYYLPVTLTPASSSDFDVSVFQGATTTGILGGTAVSADNKLNIVDAVWTINRTSGSGNCALQMSWDAALEGATFSANASDVALGISRYDGSLWSTCTKTAGSISSKSVTETFSSFSPFIIGSASFTLPVTLTNISATVKSAGVELVWETANEDGIRQYIIEKSSNGIDFNAIGFVNASNQGKYVFTDGSASTGVFYYRLKIVSVGGEIAYSKVMMVKTAAAVSVSVYPNPVSNSITISGLSGKTSLKIINTAGITLKQINTAASTLSVDVNELKAGIYMIQAVDASGRVKTVTFVKL